MMLIWTYIKYLRHFISRITNLKANSTMIIGVFLFSFLSQYGSEAEGYSCTQSSRFHCNNGECIYPHEWCDGSDDCSDGSDEEYCNRNFLFIKECEFYHFECEHYPSMCIPHEGYCDGYSSCSEMSDEKDCPCTEINEDEGTFQYNTEISLYRTHQKCWKFSVADRQYLHLQITANLYQRDCIYGNVTLYLQPKKCIEMKDDDEGNPAQNNTFVICNALLSKSRGGISDVLSPGSQTISHNFYGDTIIRYRSNFYTSRNEADMKDYLIFTYKKVDEMCDNLENFKCSNNSCISSEKKCDGNKDCRDGRDEENCNYIDMLAKKLVAYKVRAIQWIRKQHDADWGWKEDTQRAVVALYLAGDANFHGSNKEDDLIAKQLELEVFTYLDSRQFGKPASTELAAYISALLTICHDPRNFYGHNLIALLREDLNSLPSYAPPYIYLTLCNAKEPISESEVNALLQTLSYSLVRHGFHFELQALLILALSCIANNDPSKAYLRENITQAITNLKKEQVEDGNFGNEYTTALVLQALIANKQENATDWNPKSAVQFLISRQKKDGSFGDILTTYLIMPILNQKSLVDVGKVNCTEGLKRPRESDIALTTKNKPGKKSILKYSLVIGDEKNKVHTILLRAPENITVLELMTLAAHIDPKYKFKTHEIRKKMYVYKISGIPNDPENNKFWFIFQGVENGTLSIPEQSPGNIKVQGTDHIIMWYKTFDSMKNEDAKDDYDKERKFIPKIKMDII